MNRSLDKSLDKLIKDFEKKSKKVISSNRQLWEDTVEDDIYKVDIHIWRKKGMGNSLQTIKGNKISIMTATASYLNTLVSNGVLTMDELETMFEAVKEVKQNERNE